MPCVFMPTHIEMGQADDLGLKMGHLFFRDPLY